MANKNQKKLEAQRQAKKKKMRELIITIAVVVVLAVIITGLVLWALHQGHDHDHGNSEEPSTDQVIMSDKDEGITTEGKYYNTSLTGVGTEIDMDKVEKQINSKQVTDFVKTDDVTDFVTIRIKGYGDVVVVLRADVAPVSVANFKKLISEGFYKNTTFHRIIKDFMIQGGGYDTDGKLKSASDITGEFDSNGWENNLLHVVGVLSMARATDPNSASSQFFIMHKTSPHLDGDYAAFGYVLAGQSVVDAVANVKVTGSANQPEKDIVIEDAFFVKPVDGAGVGAEENKVTYTVQVVDENGLPIPKAEAQIYDASVVGKIVSTVTTGVNGESAEATIDLGAYYVRVTNAEGFEIENKNYSFNEGRVCKIQLKAKG